MPDLSELIKHSGLQYHGPKDHHVSVNGIKFDSREISSGDLFVAIEGEYFDGHSYITDAIKKGASAVVGGKKIEELNIPYFFTQNPRLALAQLSAAFFGYPARKLTVIAVTGTDGKTTTVNLIHQALLKCGIKAGMISTVNAVIDNENIDTGFHVTTPEAPTIQELLRKMVDAGLTHVVLEATSHGLIQERVAACEIDVAVITNITHEHLDYHQNYDGYFNAKFRLIEELLISHNKNRIFNRYAVINQDDISYPRLINRLANIEYSDIKKLTYGSQPENHVGYKNLLSKVDGLRFTANIKGEEFDVKSSLIGTYNVSNIMAALTSTVLALGLDPVRVIEGIESLDYVSGRMERIDLGQKFLAIVDFAHTPNALKVALQTARGMTEGRVIAVFGSAGLRDRQKRRLMAKQAIELADISIFTAEDPRTEKLEDILAEMADEAMIHGGKIEKDFYVVMDRGEAIKRAVRMAEREDIVIACGKGHEQSMCFSTIEYEWDDRTALKAALAELLGIPGPKMPYLPTQK